MSATMRILPRLSVLQVPDGVLVVAFGLGCPSARGIALAFPLGFRRPTAQLEAPVLLVAGERDKRTNMVADRQRDRRERRVHGFVLSRSWRSPSRVASFSARSG